MKKIVKKLLLTSLLFSAAIIPEKAHASFFNWTTLSNGIAEIGSKTANLLITNSSKALNFLKNHPVVAGATALGIVFGLYKLRSNRQQRQLNHDHFLRMIKKNQVEKVKKVLLKGKVDINQQDELGLTTPLISAVYLENIEIVELLLKNGADPNLKDCYDETALTIAVKKNIKLATLLIEHKADVNGEALMHATGYGNIESVVLLIEHKADVNRQDHFGETALMNAARNGNEKLTTLLIEHNANLNLQDNYGQTALMNAAQINNAAEVTLLLQNGANPDLEGFCKFDEPDVSKRVTAYDLGNNEIKEIIAAFKRQELQKITTLNKLLPTDLVKLTAEFTY
jgi:ankyrin repeat protein